ncbi:uncharacterized protein GGS25DRAFT_482190, partial [Hypoxylon fragiforme]|uniref:uncharacterized protein n=1 Tax=Hypoxylon fragiforme TaxID=63214 RepID=UPI0020C6ECD9
MSLIRSLGMLTYLGYLTYVISWLLDVFQQNHLQSTGYYRSDRTYGFFFFCQTVSYLMIARSRCGFQQRTYKKKEKKKKKKKKNRPLFQGWRCSTLV